MPSYTPIIPLENVYMAAGLNHQKKNLAIWELRLLVWHLHFTCLQLSHLISSRPFF